MKDVDKEDIKRYYEFVEHTAKANDRIAVEPRDLPITKGLQESIHAFEVLEPGYRTRTYFGEDRSRAADGSAL